MDISHFRTEYPAEFKEAILDLDWRRVTQDLDTGRGTEAYCYLRDQLRLAAEALEVGMDDEPAYETEARLDARDRARECNWGLQL